MVILLTLLVFIIAIREFLNICRTAHIALRIEKIGDIAHNTDLNTDWIQVICLTFRFGKCYIVYVKK